MNKLALLIKSTAKPGKRDAIKELWEKHLKARAEADQNQEVYFYCYDDFDPNVFYLFEIYSDRSSFEKNGSSPWFAAYMAEVGPFMAGPPQVGMATPVWQKS